MVNDKQCTLVWYVDDNKLSLYGSEITRGFNQRLDNYFEELVVTGGKKHTFFGY